MVIQCREMLEKITCGVGKDHVWCWQRSRVVMGKTTCGVFRRLVRVSSGGCFGGYLSSQKSMPEVVCV